MSEDATLTFFSAVLAGVTAVLVWVTWRLGTITKSVGESSDALKIIPFLTFADYENYSNMMRFSIKNIGAGPAKFSTVKVKIDGKEVEVKAVSKGDYAEPQVLYYFDMPSLELKQVVEIEIHYTDMKGKSPQVFKKSITHE